MPSTASATPTAGPLPGVPVADISATGPGRTPMQQLMGLMRTHGPVPVRRLHGRDVTFVADLDRGRRGQWLTALMAEGRYVEDVYAAG